MAEEYSVDMLEKLSFLEFMSAYNEKNIQVSGKNLYSAVAHYVTKDPNVLVLFDPMQNLSSALETQPDIDINFLKSIQTQILSSDKVLNVMKDDVKAKPGVRYALLTLSWAINFGLAGKRSVKSK